MVRDGARWPRIRRAALDAWTRSQRDEPNRVPRLRALLAEIHADAANDQQGELAATLLSALYPSSLSPGEVWDFFSSGRGIPQQYTLEFWQELSRTCPEGHLAAHLDRLASSIGTLRNELQDPLSSAIPLQLLVRALEFDGKRVETSRLY